MKRVILIIALLGAAAFLRPRSAGACDHAICTFVYDVEGNPAGYGCRADAGSNSNCIATVSRCRLSGCGETGVVSDGDGRLLAVAEFCRGNVLQVRTVPADAPGASLVFSPTAVCTGARDTGPYAD